MADSSSSKSSNQEKLAALEAEMDERVSGALSLMFFDLPLLQQLMLNELYGAKKDLFVLKHGDENITAKMQPIPQQDFLLSQLMMMLPFQFSSIQISPNLLTLSADELSIKLTKALQQAHLDNFLLWSEYVNKLYQFWWENSAQNQVSETERRNASEKATKNHQETKDFLEKYFADEFEQIWQKGLARSLKSHPYMKTLLGQFQAQSNKLCTIATMWVNWRTQKDQEAE